MHIFGVTLIGANEQNFQKLVLTIGLVAVVLLVSWLLRQAARLLDLLHNKRVAFWTRQVINILAALFLILGIASIWFDDPERLATAVGLVTAGLAFALQRVITAVAGYFVILRGRTFNVGDRIVMGGVRGDVIALSFMQTTIMEMGQQPAEQGDSPSMWVRSRQYTGRVVTVSNAQVFEEPIYNYTRDFPYIWEKMVVPVRYADDRRKAEEILLEAAARETAALGEIGEEALAELNRRYHSRSSDTRPRVYLRLTDNWVELTVRFLVGDHGSREIKDRMSREILDRFDEAGLQIASAPYEIVGVPEVKVKASLEDGNAR